MIRRSKAGAGAYLRTDLTFVCRACDVDLVLTLRTRVENAAVWMHRLTIPCPGCARALRKDGSMRRDPYQGPNPVRRPPRLPPEAEG